MPKNGNALSWFFKWKPNCLKGDKAACTRKRRCVLAKRSGSTLWDARKVAIFLTRSLPWVIFTNSHPGGQHFWQCYFRFWRKGWVIYRETNSKWNTTWSKSNEFQTYDGAKVTVFARFESESARGRHCLCSRSDAARRNFFKPIDWTQEATMVKVTIFFPSSSVKCMIVILPKFWHSAPALKFSWQLTRNVSLATMLVHSYRRSIPRRRLSERSLSVQWVGTSKSSFTSAVWSFFSPGAPVTSFLSQPISTVIRRPRFQEDETSSLLDHRRHEGHQTYSSYQLLSHLGISTTLFPAIWTKTARSIEEQFSQWKRPKRASSDQRTDEEDTSETCHNNRVGGRALTNA